MRTIINKAKESYKILLLILYQKYLKTHLIDTKLVIKIKIIQQILKNVKQIREKIQKKFHIF